MSETGHAIEDFLPYQIIFHPAEMFKDMSTKELNLLLKLFASIDQGDFSNQKIRPAYHAIGGAIGILKNIVKP